MRFFRQIGDLNGWKRFGFEVAIIIVGLGITLIAQDLISNANRARATREAIDAVEVELVMLYLHSSERLAVEPCRREQIRALADRIERSNGYWTAEIPESINRNTEHMVLPRVLRSPRRPWSDATWRALLASEYRRGPAPSGGSTPSRSPAAKRGNARPLRRSSPLDLRHWKRRMAAGSPAFIPWPMWPRSPMGCCPAS